MKQMYLIIATIICCTVGLFAQNSPYVSRVLEYKPAPGQFINTQTWGSPLSAQSVIGGVNGHVSLGAYGGYIIVGFDHSIKNDSNNPFGVDFTIFGNAFTGWSEPGIVQVMKDDNQNGLPDDTWYELKGSKYDSATTVLNYFIMYVNPGSCTDVPWRDNLNRRGAVLTNSYHTQAYYPSTDSFPNVNIIRETYNGTLITGNIDDSNPSYIRSFALDFGYADNHIKQSGNPVTEPDNPNTVNTLEGAGGDAMKIEWAIDTQGNPVNLDEIDFVKIHTGLNRMCGWLGEVSTEICGVVDVAPNKTQQSANILTNKNITPDNSQKTITVHPSQTNLKSSISSQGFKVFNIQGELVLETKTENINKIDFSVLKIGIYLAKTNSQQNIETYKITIE